MLHSKISIAKYSADSALRSFLACDGGKHFFQKQEYFNFISKWRKDNIHFTRKRWIVTWQKWQWFSLPQNVIHFEESKGDNSCTKKNPQCVPLYCNTHIVILSAEAQLERYLISFIPLTLHLVNFLYTMLCKHSNVIKYVF